MDWWLFVERLGFKFDPPEVQLILDYLYPKVRGLGGPCDLIGISDQVYKKPPWEYYSDMAFPGGEKYYCFTKLKQVSENQNRVNRTVGSYCTWHESNCKKIRRGNNYITNNDGIIGFNKLLNFKVNVGGEKVNTDWIMHEFSLPGNYTDLVLCVIQNKKKKEGEEMGSACDTLHDHYLSYHHDIDFTTPAVGDPCPGTALASVHDDHFLLQALDSEEQETPPSPLVNVSGIRNDIIIASSNVTGYPNYYFLGLRTPPYEGDSSAGVKAL